MSKKDKPEEDITKYTEGTRMDDAYYFLPDWMWPQSEHRKKPSPVYEKGYPSYDAVNGKEEKKEKDNETE